MAEILISPLNHRGRIYQLTGPKSEHLNQVVEAYSKALGRKVKYQALSFEEWANLYLKSSGLPDDGRAASGKPLDRLTKVVEAVTGQKPMTIEQWVLENRRGFNE
jgi:NAD(P)H dehydrogenase (quinone)